MSDLTWILIACAKTQCINSTHLKWQSIEWLLEVDFSFTKQYFDSCIFQFVHKKGVNHQNKCHLYEAIYAVKPCSQDLVLRKIKGERFVLVNSAASEAANWVCPLLWQVIRNVLHCTQAHSNTYITEIESTGWTFKRRGNEAEELLSFFLSVWTTAHH